MDLRSIRNIKMDININIILKKSKRKLNYIGNLCLYKLWKFYYIIFDFKNFKSDYLTPYKIYNKLDLLWRIIR